MHPFGTARRTHRTGLKLVVVKSPPECRDFKSNKALTGQLPPLVAVSARPLTLDLVVVVVVDPSEGTSSESSEWQNLLE